MGDSKEKAKNNRFTKRIGATTYVVNVHFAEMDSATVRAACYTLSEMISVTMVCLHWQKNDFEKVLL